MNIQGSITKESTSFRTTQFPIHWCNIQFIKHPVDGLLGWSLETRFSCWISWLITLGKWFYMTSIIACLCHVLKEVVLEESPLLGWASCGGSKLSRMQAMTFKLICVNRLIENYDRRLDLQRDGRLVRKDLSAIESRSADVTHA